MTEMYPGITPLTVKGERRPTVARPRVILGELLPDSYFYQVKSILYAASLEFARMIGCRLPPRGRTT